MVQIEDKKMKILVTGAKGFIGKNLIAELKSQGIGEVFCFDLNDDISVLDTCCKDCDFIFHLAGINRPKDKTEYRGNYDFTKQLLDLLDKHHNYPSILFSSSIQVALNNEYGYSKLQAEKELLKYQDKYHSEVLIYRLPNVYGKWGRPNYNSVVATLCYNIPRNIETVIDDKNKRLSLVYIDDVVKEFVLALKGHGNKVGRFYEVPVEHHVSLGKVQELIESFNSIKETLMLPNTHNYFEKTLYATFLSYLPKERMSYFLKQNVDNRGAFIEVLKSLNHGQVSLNIAHPGITKGNHWHATKNEKFVVLKGHCLIKMRKVDEKEVITFDVDGDQLQVVDILPGYTHSITNIGEEDSLTLMWASECFDPEHTDTIYLEVE